jgi:hypothetical protein
MTRDAVDDMVRRAMGGDDDAAAWIAAQVSTTDRAIVLVMAALLAHDPALLDGGRALAVTSRDRQIVEIARAQLQGRVEQVDALARDHLVDHPDSLLVAWVASGAVVPHRHDGS